MIIYGLLLGVLVLTFILIYLNKKKYEGLDELRKVKVHSNVVHLTQYILFIIIGYLITDTLVDFFIVITCYFIIYLFYYAMYNEWFKSKLFIRLLFVSCVPIVLLLMICYCSQFVLVSLSNFVQIIFVIAISSNTRSRHRCRRMDIEMVILALSFILCYIIVQHGYLDDIQTKPQIHAVRYINKLDLINKDDVKKIGKRDGLRGDLIKIYIETKYEVYKVYYQSDNIIKYEILE